MKPKIVRAELQYEDHLYLSTDIGCVPYWKDESEGGDSETNTKQVVNNISSIHNHLSSTKSSKCFKVDAKDNKIVRGELKFNDLLCLSSDVECMPPLKYNSGDNNSATNPNKIATHRKNKKYSMQQDCNAIQEEAESECNVISMHQEILSAIKNDCPPVPNSEYSSALQGSQRWKKVEQKAHKRISPSGSQILQVSTTPEDNCNVEKKMSINVIQVGLTEESQCSVVIRKQKQINSNSSRGTVHPESFETSTDLSHPQQPMIDAENTQYKSTGNFFMLTTPTIQVEDSGVDPMPKTMSECPKHPEHAPLSSRITSYTSWPAHLDQTPQQMAEAGFFYAGISDHTHHFQCGGGLRNWEPGDDPWIGQARWYPQCAYVLGKRGQKSGNAVLQKQAELLAAQNGEQYNSSSTTTTITRSGTGMNSKSHSVQESSLQSDQQRYIQNPPKNDSTKKLIEEMVYKQGTVQEAKLEVRRRKGKQRISIEHAVELSPADDDKRAGSWRQNEAAAMEILTRWNGQFTQHVDNNPLKSPIPPTEKSTVFPSPLATAKSNQSSGQPHQVAGARSIRQQQSGQINQTTGQGSTFSIPYIEQNISGPVKIVAYVPLVDNHDGHKSIKAAIRPSSPPQLEPAALLVQNDESLRKSGESE